MSQKLTNITSTISKLEEEIANVKGSSNKQLQPYNEQEWWKKQWNSDNKAVYQYDNYTPWKSLYIQGQNKQYTVEQLKENFIR